MAQSYSGIEAVTMSEVLGLNTWDRERSTDDLKSFIDRKHEELNIDNEDFL